MISKKIFLEQIEKLQTAFDEEVSESRFRVYYDTLSSDFTDKDFLEQVNVVLRNNFKFPAIAAFYRGEGGELYVPPKPLTPEEIALREIRRKMLREMEEKAGPDEY